MLAAALLLLVPAGEARTLPQEEGKGSQRVIIDRERHGALVMQLAPNGARPEVPLLILMHESRSSRGEYQPILPRLHELGYSTLNVDLSAGHECREVKNVTARKAAESGRTPNYLDAQRDIQDAVAWARQDPARGKVLLVGSGYSASLALVYAAEHPDLVDGVAAFSPGEVFTGLGKTATWVQESARSYEGPVWITSARNEEKDWRPIFAALASPLKSSFLPEGPGLHGARALWPELEGSAAYSKAFEAFLAQHAPLPPTTPPSGD